MSTFSTFEFYRDEFYGRLSEAEYNASVNEAHAEIISQTNGRANSAPAEMESAVKLCECELVDIIDAFKTTTSSIPRGVSSVSNDGYSVTVGATPLSKSERQERAKICSTYLQVPVNLMSRWI